MDFLAVQLRLFCDWKKYFKQFCKLNHMQLKSMYLLNIDTLFFVGTCVFRTCKAVRANSITQYRF